MTIKEQIRFIRNAQPKCLKELFEMQNRRCDLCGQPIQDVVCAVIDHSTPIIRFLHLPIAEAARQANDPANLRCAHIECNSTKKTLTREEWFARGLNDRTPRPYTPAELEVFRIWASGRQKTRAAAGGRVQGPRSRDQKIGIFARTPEERLADSAAGGRIGGRINASTEGFMSRMGRKGGATTVRDRKGIFARTPEQHSSDSHKAGLAAAKTNLASGHIQALGRKNAENGHLKRIATPESCAAGGRLGGQTNIKSGHLARLNRLNAVRRFQRQVTSLCSNILQEAV